MGDGVILGVDVNVGVKVGVAVDVFVEVNVADGVCEGVSVNVLVGVRVSVGGMGVGVLLLFSISSSFVAVGVHGAPAASKQPPCASVPLCGLIKTANQKIKIMNLKSLC